MNHEVAEELITGMTCRWCRPIGFTGRTICDEPSFVVVETPPGRGARSLILVPRAHVNVVTELPRSEMAAVLAGLTRASELLRRTSGAAEVQVHAHSDQPGHGHLYFQLGTVCSANEPSGDEFSGSVATGRCSWAVDGPSVFASLAEAIGH